MKNTMRILTLAGMGLIAGASLGVGPAQAATATGQANAGASANQQINRWGNDEVVGFYRNLRTCQQAGRVGEWNRAWNDFDCERVGLGVRRGAYALVVDDNDWGTQWTSRWRPGHWPTNWTFRPTWPGNDGPRRHSQGRPGNDNHGRPGNDSHDNHGGRPGNDSHDNHGGRPDNDSHHQSGGSQHHS